MESEGPYKHYQYIVPYGKCVPLKCPACAFSEGRKAAEKDLRELLSITEKLYCATDEAFSCPELFAWKKARGIE